MNKRSQASQSQPDTPQKYRGVRSKTQGMDFPNTTVPARRLSLATTRKEFPARAASTPSLRHSDTLSPLYETYSHSNNISDGYVECDKCGNMLNISDTSFDSHSGFDKRTIEFPTTYYQGGALNLNYVRAYMEVTDLVTRRSLAYVPALVGPPPPDDLFQLAIDYANKKKTVLDMYKFKDIPNYLWDDIWSPNQQKTVDVVATDGKVIPVSMDSEPAPVLTPATAPPTSYFRSAAPTAAPTFVPQSGNLEQIAVVEQHDQQHLIGFSDENEDWHSSILHSKDDSFYCADTGEAQLSDFFRRPVLIATRTWDYNAAVQFTINPWALFFDNPRVSNRVANYRNLRCNLKVKILVNGTPFDYGRGMFYYIPLPGADAYTASSTDNNDFVILSQRLHLYIDPSTSQGGTMTLPYFYPNNSLNVPSREWGNLGSLGFKVIADLKNCNGVISPVTISIFAWAEDVILSVPTSQEPAGLVAQAGDEYGEGIVSRPAAILAKVAGRLSHIPVIGPYATAAEIGATATGNIFKLFGMSKPNIVSDTIYVKQNPLGHLSCVDNPDPIQKLSFDSKQCVTLDPRTVGLAGEDEMNIAAIAQREAYLTDFVWRQTAAPETMLFNIAVLPSVWNSGLEVALPNARTRVQLPPCAAMALPFTYWRGTMRYRFQIVKSSFHKGRIRVVYEPGQFTGVTCEYNTNMAEIIDIGDNIDFVVEVGWHAHQQYLRLMAPGSIGTDNIFKSTSTRIGASAPIVSPINLPNVANGSLGIFVVNTLECPAPAATVNNDIRVIVSVSAGSDFEVFQPTDILQSYTFSPQMGAENVLSDVDSGIPTSPSVIVKFGKSIPSTDKTALVCYGDPVLNIRSLLKRYMMADTFQPAPTVANPTVSQWIMTMSAFPYARGLHPFGVHLFGTKAGNISTMTHLNYYSVMFQARRGGIRNKFVCVANAADINAKSLTRTENPAFTNSYTAIPASTTLSAHALRRLGTKVSGWMGTAVNLRQNDLFEAEIPYSSDTRFIPARGKLNYSTIDYPIRLEAVTAANAVPSGLILDRYVAAADDYNLFWFTGCPPITYMATASQIS